MKNSNIKNHILRRATLMVIVLSPLSVHSLNSDILNKEKNPIETVSSQEALEGSLMGVVLNRSDGTSCGLMVENENTHSLTKKSTQSNLSFLAFKEDMRKAFSQHNIPLCSSSEDLKVIEQTNEAFKTDQIFEEHPTVQIAGLGRVLFSTPLRAAITSIAGTCVISASSWSLTYLYFVVNSFGKDNIYDLGIPMVTVTVGISIAGSIVTSVIGGTITGEKLGKATQGNTFKKIIKGTGGGLGTGVASLIGGVACFYLGEYSTAILLGAILGL